MTAIRIIDDHIQLASIGSNTHAQIDTHIADSSIHQTKYTDAEAVAAVEGSGKFLELNETNAVSSLTSTTLSKTGVVPFLVFLETRPAPVITGNLMVAKLQSTTHSFLNTLSLINFPAVELQGTDINKTIFYIAVRKNMGALNSWVEYNILDAAGNAIIPLKIHHDKIDVNNLPIKDIKNHAHSALSGTKKLVELDIGGMPYYFEVYPNKV